MFKRLISTVSASAIVAGALVAATTAPAAASVPDPTNTQSVVTVKVGGTRTGVSDVTGLAGVVLELWTNVNGEPGQKVADAWGECTSDTDGDCNFTVPDTNFGGDNSARARGLMFALVNRFQPEWTEQRSLDRGEDE